MFEVYNCFVLLENSGEGEGTSSQCKRPSNLPQLTPLAKRPRMNFLSDSDSDDYVEALTEPPVGTSADRSGISHAPSPEPNSFVPVQVMWPYPPQWSTSINCPHPKPASKCELDTLDIYEERMTVSVWENYLSHLERVTAGGHFLTKDRLLGVLTTMKAVDDGDFTRRVCAALQQDLQVRSDTTLDTEPLSKLLQSCLSSAIVGEPSAKPAMSPFTAHSILHYLAALLVKDLNHHLTQGLDLTATLVQKTLGIQRQWRVVNQLVGTLFFVASKRAELPTELTDLTEVLAMMLCLPLVTCPAMELNNSVGRLADEISRKLEGVASFEAKQALLLSLPSPILCARVVDLHLNNFVIYPDVDLLMIAQRQSEQLTLQKVAHVHLCRTPYHPDGTHDLHFFLFLLLCLLQNFPWATTVGAPVLTCMAPVTSSQPLLPLQHFQLLPHFNLLIDRIAEDNVQLEFLTSPECWAVIQLIRTLLLHLQPPKPPFVLRQ